MRKRLVVVGGRGSGEIAMSVFEAANSITDEWALEGFLTDIVEPGGRLGRHSVLGGTSEAADFASRGYHIHYALHLNAKKKAERVAAFEALGIPREANASAIHPAAHVEPSAEIGVGVIIAAMAATSFNVRIDDHVHVYTGAFFGHDCHVRDYATVAGHGIVGARVVVGPGAHVGLNSSIREDVTIGEYGIIGMGSVVLRDVEPFEIVGGNPARTLGTVDRGDDPA